MRTIHIGMLGVILLVVGSCRNEKAPETEESKENEWIQQEINQAGFQFLVSVPSVDIIKKEVAYTFDEELGELWMDGGENFKLWVYEDEPHMEEKRAGISHPYYDTEVAIETDSTLVYRHYKEGETTSFWHVYVERSIRGTSIIIESDPEQQFNEFYARKMLESALAIKPHAK